MKTRILASAIVLIGPPVSRPGCRRRCRPTCRRRSRAIAIDVGDQDGLRADTGKLRDILDTYGIANTFELYPGTHTSKVADRFQNHVMTFFSANLSFEAGRR